jgi:YD repeat-containing protein
VFSPIGGALPESTDEDQTTGYTYDGDGHVLTQTAIEPSGTPSQVTQYVYGPEKGSEAIYFSSSSGDKKGQKPFS